MSDMARDIRTGGDVPPPRSRRRRRRRAIVIVTVLVVLAAGGTAVVERARIERLWNSSGASTSDSAIDNGSPVSTATVARRDLTAQQQVDGKLGYTGSYTVLGKASGSLTWLPGVGDVIKRGHRLYEVDDTPVELMYGAKPAYRDLSAGASGADVKELNANLVALGYADRDALDPTSDDFGAATTYAVEKLQDHLGVTQDGVLHLGQVVFLPTALRITKVEATLSGQGTGQILKGSSTTRQVVVDLDANQQSEVKKGDKVTIALPNGKTTEGTVAKVGTVATSSSDDSDSGSSSDTTSTVEVDIALSNPSATGDLDQAPVQVNITTDTASNALVVPVTALLALTGGGYGVEADGTHRLVEVTLGLFDDAHGLVQVTNTTLQPGQKILVAGS